MRGRVWFGSGAGVRAVGAVVGATLVVPTFVLLGCGEGPTGPGGDGRITELPRPLSSVEQSVLRASNAFAFEMAGGLLAAKPAENLFFSPLSASMLLGMILNGANGRTYEQMRDVLAFDGLSQEAINDGYRDLAGLLLTLDPAVTVEIGNSVWTDLGFAVQPDFMERVRTSFDAEARSVDLGAPGTLDQINGWASDATHGRIAKIFDELPSNAVMVLLNAIYFKANWTTEFDRSETQAAPFTRPDGSQVTADLMRLEAELPVAWRDGTAIVDLPYGGEAFSMTVVVPAAGTSVNEVVATLGDEVWQGWTGDLHEGRAVVYLPRFELEWEAELNELLQALGMPDAFDPAAADFSRLTPGGGVWLALVKQKAFVKVDEEGTEAAAVTGGIVVDSAPAEVRADRPFLFVLRERLTGAILFMGVVNDPTA